MKADRKISLLFMMLFVLHWPLQSQEAEKERAEQGTNVGIIFNTNNILMEVESYQAGVGIKIGDNSFAFRGMFDVYYSQMSDTLSFDIGMSLEYHLFPGIVSPYLGGFIKGGYSSIYNEFDEENYTQSVSIPVSIGPIFGVEVFPLKFLSFFAEYAVSTKMLYTNDIVSSAGTITEKQNVNFTVDSGLGNNSKIGIVIYFSRIGGIELPEEEVDEE